jgi:hypothetical protein
MMEKPTSMHKIERAERQGFVENVVTQRLKVRTFQLLEKCGVDVRGDNLSFPSDLLAEPQRD